MPVAAITPTALLPALDTLFSASAAKIDATEAAWRPEEGSPVFTVEGRWRARGWTEWTQGFQFGSALLQFDATGDRHFLELGRSRTVERMAPHLTHVGVHDHGFNNVSTYGALWRLAREGRYEASDWERRFYALALQVSGAVQARRWTRIPSGGYVYSFNGAHSLFVDTVRSLRALAIAHQLGHRLAEEQDAQVSLLERLVQHAKATADFSVYYGTGRDTYDRRGRTAHESLFNVANGTYRGPSSQQGYSPFSTWTRGLAWAMLGFAEQLEFIATVSDDELAPLGGRETVEGFMREAAQATSDFYIDEAVAQDGIPYWDTGAPGLAALGDWRTRPSDPFNDHEPVDSSAAAIAAQGLLRLGRHLSSRGRDGERYMQAGLRVVATLTDPAGPYLSTDASHHGLLLHSVYHWPNGWDHVPAGARIPRGESSQWGDYHLREVALYVRRLATGAPYLTFFGPAAAESGMTAAPRTAIVTGGTRGIGFGIARALAAEGWQLVVSGVRPAADVAAALDELAGLGAAVHYCASDIAVADDRARLVTETVARFGGIDALVNNAGRAPAVRADILDAGEESFETLVRTNLQGPYFLTQQVARHMLERGRGTGIVFVTSVSAELASINRGDYCVSKAGLAMAVRLFALRLAAQAIPVFEVRPGIIATDMTARVKDVYDRRIADGLVPEGRWGTPADVGRVIASLLRGDAPYATGSVIHVDGGLALGRL